jgi:hypothetical protein
VATWAFPNANFDLEQPQAELIAIVQQIFDKWGQTLAVQPGAVGVVEIRDIRQRLSASQTEVAAGNTSFMSAKGGQVKVRLSATALADRSSEGDRVGTGKREHRPVDFQ